MKTMTPMMQQYTSIKERHADSILLFRLGDFYEMFFEDAKVAARELEIALTQRDMGNGEKAAMCGVPHHSSDPYIAKLVERGYKVAICEQLEDPKEAKGIVERDVVRVITPGTVINTQEIRADNNHLLAVHYHTTGFALAAVDIGTGELSVTAFEDAAIAAYPLLLDEIARWQPSEILLSDTLFGNESFQTEMTDRYGCLMTVYDRYSFSSEEQVEYIRTKLPLLNKKSPIFQSPTAIQVLHGLLQYIYQYQKEPLKHLQTARWYDLSIWMGIDQNTRSHLEIQKNLRTADSKNTLFSVLHHTKTAMGTRKLHQFLERPLRREKEIEQRLDIVEALVDAPTDRLHVASHLDGVHDMDRLVGKLSYQRANARDLLALKNSLANVHQLKSYLLRTASPLLREYGDRIDVLEDVSTLIEDSINEDPPIGLTEGGLIKVGYHEELDQLRDTSLRGQEALLQYEMDEREATGIKNLKIVYHKNKGYYLDVTKSHLEKVPAHYNRAQTLTNSERYTTDQLLSIQRMVQDSSFETRELEYEIFQEIRSFILDRTERLQRTSSIVAELDVFYSFAHAATLHQYVRPRFRKDAKILIEEGRHPVVEQNLPEGGFIHNDTDIGSPTNLIQVITGPNMAGKSTYMRQVALIVLMAQIGSFVPAKSCRMGIVDQLFTRIGATDHVSSGDSTFMVEMKEMAYILAHATPKSLLILDEIGRGTSTFDGMSIAWAIMEHLATECKAKTLFATHYHELTALADHFDEIKNMTIAVREEVTHIVFLRKIMAGQTDRSYGIEVAKMANFPASIIYRATQVLRELEKSRHDISLPLPSAEDPIVQMDLRDIELKQFAASIQKIDIDSMTPIEALNTLQRLQQTAIELGEK